jgi:hypothetical protein
MPVRRKADKGVCAVPGCGRPAETAGFCGACYCSWYRLRDMGMREIANYLWRVKRFAARVPILSERKPSRR